MRYLLLALIVLAPFANADKDKGVYVGGGISLVSVGVRDPFSNEVNFKAGELLIGYKHKPWLGAEVRYGRSLQNESIAVNDLDTGLRDSVSAGIEEYTSYYYRAELANEIAKVYLLLGKTSLTTSLEFESSALGTIVTDDSGLSYGLGFGMWLDERMNLNFEFKALVDTDSDTFTSGTIGADYRF